MICSTCKSRFIMYSSRCDFTPYRCRDETGGQTYYDGENDNSQRKRCVWFCGPAGFAKSLANTDYKNCGYQKAPTCSGTANKVGIDEKFIYIFFSGYSALALQQIEETESPEITVIRFSDYWHDTIQDDEISKAHEWVNTPLVRKGVM